MRRGIVVLDSSEGAQQAAYTAFHVAARSGMDLVGVVTTDPTDPEQSQPVVRNFLTGAHAARVNASTVFLSERLPSTILYQFLENDAIFISRSLAPETIQQFISILPWPVWVIPEHRAIRKILAILDGSPPKSGTLPLASWIARSWSVDLHLLLPEQLPGEQFPSAQFTGLPITIETLVNPEGDSRAKTLRSKAYSALEKTGGNLTNSPSSRGFNPDMDHLNQIVQTKMIDLLLIDRENSRISAWDACMNCDCLVVVSSST